VCHIDFGSFLGVRWVWGCQDPVTAGSGRAVSLRAAILHKDWQRDGRQLDRTEGGQRTERGPSSAVSEVVAIAANLGARADWPSTYAVLTDRNYFSP